MPKDYDKIEQLLERIAAALEARRPAAGESFDAQLKSAGAFVWEADGAQLVPVERVAALPLALLKGIDPARDTLFENTRRFADGLPANNALLWGARGMGKSSLVKAVHEAVNKGRAAEARLALIEIHREDIVSLPLLLRRPARFEAAVSVVL
jgi:predicted AAA+ superfamily ATPase